MRGFFTNFSFIPLILLLVISFHQSFAQQFLFGNLEISTGFSKMEFQSVSSLQGSSALEAAARGNLTERFDWQLGARLGLDPVLPEGFIRLITFQEFGSWCPFVGLEIGVSDRTRFDEGKKLLRETREATAGNISPFYVACQTAPLSFKVWDKWRLSLLEIQFGTHLGKIGRTLRLQIGIITIGRSL